MKFYSEELKRLFDTEEQCLAEEEKERQALEEKKVTKAKLAKVVEDADKALDAAYEELKAAQEAVKELQKDYDAQVDAIMNPAMDKVKECTKARTEAIKAFNDNFGVYTTTYTGNRAVNEFLKTLSDLDYIWKRFYY